MKGFEINKDGEYELYDDSLISDYCKFRFGRKIVNLFGRTREEQAHFDACPVTWGHSDFNKTIQVNSYKEAWEYKVEMIITISLGEWREFKLSKVL